MSRASFSADWFSEQLKKLKSAEYARIKKSFEDDKPHTTVSITSQGARALNNYLGTPSGTSLSNQVSTGLIKIVLLFKDVPLSCAIIGRRGIARGWSGSLGIEIWRAHV
jgi:hypothetical protein